MNPYEKKVVDFFKFRRHCQQNYNEDIAEYEARLNALTMKKNALNITLQNFQDSDETSIVVKVTLEKEIEIIKSEISKVKTLLKNRIKNLDDLKSEISFMQDHICPHVDTVYDGTDYHKGIDFYKCTLCGGSC